jgi:hypothetical protein
VTCARVTGGLFIALSPKCLTCDNGCDKPSMNKPPGTTPCEHNVRDRLFVFYDWCARNDDIPELVSLALAGKLCVCQAALACTDWIRR